MSQKVTVISDTAAWASAAFSDHKVLFEHSLGFSSDAVHVLAGVAIQVAVAMLIRRTLAHWLPLTVVIMLEFANEANDLLQEQWPSAAMQLGEGMKDILLTLAVPVCLFLLARFRPSLFARPAQPSQRSSIQP